jgi:hypothetical protein
MQAFVPKLDKIPFAQVENELNKGILDNKANSPLRSARDTLNNSVAKIKTYQRAPLTEQKENFETWREEDLKEIE